MFVIKYKKIFFIISGVFVLLSIFSISIFGLNLGIDFTGGSILEVSYFEERPDFSAIQRVIDELDLGVYTLQTIGDNGFVIKLRFLTEEERISLVNAFSMSGNLQVTEERFNSIGPAIGSELKRKALVAIAVVVIMIILFITYVFRQVSRPVSSWKYGLVAIVALIHDIIIPVGIFTFLGYLIGFEIDILFVMALLAILGFSVNDTIVVFDRIRENLKINQEINKKEKFEDTVGKSLSQTFIRSINTSVTTFFVLLTLFLFGGEVTKNFSLVLMMGIIFGTYSSIFLASPLILVMGENKAK